MIIFGTKVIQNLISSGKFHCPNCKKEQSYRLKKPIKYFHLFFVPLFPLEEYGDVAECIFCHTAYVPGTVLPDTEYQASNPIDQSNTDNLIGLNRSDFGKRIGAFAIDGFIVFLLISILSFLQAWFIIGITVFVYLFSCDVLLKGSSLGKLALSLKVSEYEVDKVPSIPKLFIRNLIKAVCAIFPFIYLFALANMDYQTLHDKLANTMVIDRKN